MEPESQSAKASPFKQFVHFVQFVQFVRAVAAGLGFAGPGRGGKRDTNNINESLIALNRLILKKSKSIKENSSNFQIRGV